ncbi:putative receptor-like protein kinase At3g47110 [Cornus florida]|uniref:putative receptor-like protein kinase At3g47110 n=1 Tax=Cornus florida TaxID=4283 RepID=UPI00289C66BF|nr:putative receptor-like protein kinase At3g47110 [Cornus florida]
MNAMDNTSCFLFSISLLVSFFIVCLSSSITNLTTDQFALLAVRDHITRNPEDVLASNWSTTSSVCNWVGVSCGLRHHRVTALNLSRTGLQGTIAPHLGNLSFIASLDISHNNFNGYVPQELAHLH